MSHRRVARPTLIGACYDRESSFAFGTAEAPAAIRKALLSPAGNLFAEDGTDIGSLLGEDSGDLPLNSSPEPREALSAALGSILDAGAIPVVLGGDHAITFPAVRAVASRFARLTIVHIDAHPDLYDNFDGNRYSHACPFARIMEAGLADRLIQIGIRATTAHQREQQSRFGVEVFPPDSLHELQGVQISAPVYLSLDIDAIDPAFAPGVSHREPGGLTVRDVIRVVGSLKGKVVAADLVEYNPLRDLDGVTANVAAKLLKEILAAVAA